MGSSIIVIIVTAIIVLVLAAIIIAKLRNRGSGSSGAADASSSSAQLYVGNLSYRVRERDLRNFFSEYGEISQLKVVKDRDTRRSKGFGFVTFASERDAQSALDACHGASLSGRNIVVRFAKPR